MKAMLEFDLDEPNDGQKFNVASRATDWFFVCFDLDVELRNMVKYKGAPKAVEKIRAKLHELMEDRGISLDDMS